MSWFQSPARDIKVEPTSIFHTLLPPFICYYATALFSIIPSHLPSFTYTTTLRAKLVLLPITLAAAFRTMTRLEVAECIGWPWDADGRERMVHWNQALVIIMTAISLRCIVWTFQQTPFQRRIQNDDPDHASWSRIFLDATDLCCGLRVHNWTMSRGLHIPKETRSLTSRTSFLLHTLVLALINLFLVDFFHYTAQYLMLTPVGTIFNPSLPPLERYIISSIITSCAGIVVYVSINGVYQIQTLFSVLILRQDPSQWPPLFDNPVFSTSLTTLWSKRWHQMFRDIFVGIGYYPVQALVQPLAGAALGRAVSVLGAFGVSGFLHYMGCWGMGNGTEVISMTGFFIMMGAGVLLENLVRQVVYRRTGKTLKRERRPALGLGYALVGWVWTMSWMVGWGNVIVDGWARKGLVNCMFFPDWFRPGKVVFERLVSSAGF